jgi:hypothetical protein
MQMAAMREYGIDIRAGRRGGALVAIAIAILLLAGGVAGAASLRSPGLTRILYSTGRIVPIPAAIPHEAGDMVDRRILPDLRWIAARFPIYVTDAYSGPLPGGGHAGCYGCHVKNSDHHYGLAVDIVPKRPSSRCDAAWRGITRLARWAEPRQNRPVPPFRWVGYDGDAGHGCGHHLHLSWNHAAGREYRPAAWVEVFRATGAPPAAQADSPPKPSGPSGGIRSIPAPTGGIGRGD